MIETVFDVETTGFPSKSKVCEHEDQPHIVQLGLITRANGRIVQELSLMVECPVDVPEKPLEIHGISRADTVAYGITKMAMIDTFRDLISNTDLIIAHNVDFDIAMINLETDRACEGPIKWPDTFCTMKGWAEIHGVRWPKLNAAYGMTGCEQGVLRDHNALDDCKKALAIYDHLNA